MNTEQTDQDELLAQVIAGWPNLDEQTRKTIAAIVSGALDKDGKVKAAEMRKTLLGRKAAA